MAIIMMGGCGLNQGKTINGKDLENENHNGYEVMESQKLPDDKESIFGYLYSCLYEDQIYYYNEHENGESAIVSIDCEGNDRSILLNWDRKNGEVKGFCFSKEGTLDILVLQEQIENEPDKYTLYQYNSNGKLTKGITFLGPQEGTLSQLVKTQEGKTFVICFNLSKKLMKLTDTGELEDINTSMPLYLSGIGSIRGQEGILIYDNSYLYVFDGKDEINKVIKWVDISIDESRVRNIQWMENGILFFMTDSLGKNGQVFLLQKHKNDEGSVPLVLTLATIHANTLLRNTVFEFNCAHKECQIKIKEYLEPNQNTRPSDMSDAIVKLGIDLLGDNAPDLLDLTSVIIHGTEKMITVEELLEKGYVLDLVPFVQNSKYVNLEDYEEKVLNICSHKQQIAAIPFAYTLTTLIANSDYIPLRNGWTIADFIALAQSENEPVLLEGLDCWSVFEICIEPNLCNFVDEMEGKCHFDCDEFRITAELAAQLPDNVQRKAFDFEKGKIVWCDIDRLATLPFVLFSAFGEKSYSVGYPTFDGTPTTQISIAPDVSTLAITAACKNESIAWEFIEDYLETELYDEEDDVVSFPSSNGAKLFGIPSNRKSMKSFLNYLMKDGGGMGITPTEEDIMLANIPDTVYVQQPIKPSETDFLFGVLENAKPITNREKIYMSIINDEIGAYFAGQKKLDEVIDIIQNRIEIYLAENQDIS